MSDETAKGKRSFVRGDILFKVKFSIFSSQEYEEFIKTGDWSSYAEKMPQEKDTDTISSSESFQNPYLVEFLVDIDEKLDKILFLLSKDSESKQRVREGRGVNISGSGMLMEVDEPVEPGNIISANFILSRVPFVYLNNIFGRVVKAKQKEREEGSVYRLGIKFLAIDPNDREKIISCVFQRQREIIRKRRGKEENNILY